MRALAELSPPWLEFPRIPWGSAGWRMGHGAVYWHQWMASWGAAAPSAQSGYQQRWPEPLDWQGFYAFLTTGEEPPRYREERLKTEAAAMPPRPGENEITDRYRVKWLATAYFRKPKVFVRDPYEKDFCQIVADPEGWLWKLHFPDSEGDFKAPYFTRQLSEVIGNDNLPVEQPVV